MNRTASGWIGSKFVNDITSDAIIGPRVKRTRPISHGPMKAKPHAASRTAGRSNRLAGRRWIDGVGRAPVVSLIDEVWLRRKGWGRGGRVRPPGRLGDPSARPSEEE